MNFKKQTHKDATSKDPGKTYIPTTMKQDDERDLFIDQLSYGRRNPFWKNDIWNYEYV